MFLLVLVVLVFFGRVPLGHSLPFLMILSDLVVFDGFGGFACFGGFRGFPQYSDLISIRFPTIFRVIIFLLMSLDFLRLSSGSHTPTITAQTVLPGIVEATPRLATPCHAPSSKPRHASHHARHASHHATLPTRVMQDPTIRRNLSTQVFLVNC